MQHPSHPELSHVYNVALAVRQLASEALLVLEAIAALPETTAEDDRTRRLAEAMSDLVHDMGPRFPRQLLASVDPVRELILNASSGTR